MPSAPSVGTLVGRIICVLLNQLSRLLEHSVLLYPMNGDCLGEPIFHEVEQDGGFEGIDIRKDRMIPEWVAQNAVHAGRTTRTHPEAHCLYMAIRSGRKVWAVIGIRTDNSPPIDGYRKNLMISILDECALALAKENMTRGKQRVEESARQEALRANLLRSIFHDLRTPSTSISGNAALLMENKGQLDETDRRNIFSNLNNDNIQSRPVIVLTVSKERHVIVRQSLSMTTLRVLNASFLNPLRPSQILCKPPKQCRIKNTAMEVLSWHGRKTEARKN